jgi:acyl-CoA synthetase (NDP forming)
LKPQSEIIIVYNLELKVPSTVQKLEIKFILTSPLWTVKLLVLWVVGVAQVFTEATKHQRAVATMAQELDGLLILPMCLSLVLTSTAT